MLYNSNIKKKRLYLILIVINNSPCEVNQISIEINFKRPPARNSQFHSFKRCLNTSNN